MRSMRMGSARDGASYRCCCRARKAFVHYLIIPIMPQLTLLFTFLVSAVLTAFVIPKIILISFKKRLFDFADERKVHKGIVPRLGGVAFTPVITITVALTVGLVSLFSTPAENQMYVSHSAHLALGLSALVILYMEGVTDDLIGVGYKAKFLTQLVCAVMIICTGAWIDNLHGLFGVTTLPAAVGMPLTAVLVVFIINAINLIDGIDGLASGLSGIALFFLGCLYGVCREWAFAVLAFATLGTLVPFFIYNVFGRAEVGRKIFMGDCGSQTIGLIIGMLAVKFCMIDGVVADLSLNPLVVVFSLLMVPCLDVIRVMFGRISRHRNPFMPDKTHIHHKFLALGMSHRTAMVTILFVAAFFALLNLGLMTLLNINLILLLDVVIWTLMHLWLTRTIRRRASMQAED